MQLADYTERYAQQIRHWLRPLFIDKQPALSTERYCLSIGTNEIRMLHIDKTAAYTKVISNDILRFDDAENLPLILMGFINKLSIINMPFYWVLKPEDYQLFLIESLPVEKDEFHEALQWRARSLINFPVEDAAIDCFKLPPKKSTAGNMIATVIAKKSNLTAIINILQQCQANISVIDIPELAMRQLTALYEDDEKSSAFIHFYQHEVILNITREKNLYFTRRIAIINKDDGAAIDYEQLCLELLRYFDYYQSQWRHPTPNRIFVSADDRNSEELATQLSEFMLQTVNPYTIKTVLGDTAILQALQKSNLLALGAAMREDTTHA